jgi:hypothetical protein
MILQQITPYYALLEAPAASEQIIKKMLSPSLFQHDTIVQPIQQNSLQGNRVMVWLIG